MQKLQRVPCPRMLMIVSLRRVLDPKIRSAFLPRGSRRTLLTTRLLGMAEKDAAKEQPDGMEHEASILAELASIPSISAAWIGPTTDTGNSVTVQFGQRDLAGNAIRKSFRKFNLPKQSGSGTIKLDAGFPFEFQNTILQSISPSGKHQLLVKADGDNTVLELWSGGRLAKAIQVPKTIHGKVYADRWFELGVSWSSDENRIAYVAESVQQVKTPEWGISKNNDKSPKDKAPSAGPKGWRGHGEFQEDWGELNTGKKIPGLYVLDLQKQSVATVKGLPADCSSGQVIWTPDSKGLVFVAWPHQSTNFPRLTQRLGIVYCVNRPCFLYHIADLAKDQEASKLDTGLQSNLCPQFSPDSKHLYLLSYETAVVTGAHFATASLHRLAWPSQGRADTIIPTVQESDSYDQFPGLYCPALKPRQLSFINNNRFLIGSAWRSSIQIVDATIPEAGGEAEVSSSTRMGEEYTSSDVLDVKMGLVVALRSGPRRPAALAFARIESGNSPLQWQGIDLCEPEFASPVSDALSSSEPGYKLLKVASTSGEQHNFEAVLLINTQGKKNAPTVLTPHGGPHSVFPTSFLMSNLYFNILGYNVLQVNYRGSIGFGEAALQSLPGNIGTNDVQDCMNALDQAISDGWVDKDRVVVIGGSHGGFLTGHLFAQFPNRFKAGVLRNPVVDLSLMSQISDIPDWVFIEGFGSQEGLPLARVKPDRDTLQRLWDISPASILEKVKAPMFFMLGAKDRRVAMKDAQQYVAAMRAREDAPDTRVIVFPEDTHALNKPQTEYEQWVNAAWWVKKYLDS